MSDHKPQLRELALALNVLSWTEVKSMAVQLGMEFFRLQHIEQQNTAVSDRLLSAMDMWLNSDPNASWARIIKALNDTDKSVLAKEIEQKYCQSLDTPHATTEECSLPSPSLHMHIPDSTKVSSPPTPQAPSSNQLTPSQPSPDPPVPISPTSETTTSPHTMSVYSANGDTPASFPEQGQSQPPSSPTQLSRKRKRRNSPTHPISLSPSPSPQPPPQPPQPPQLSTTQPQELPGWQPRITREPKRERIRRVKQEASRSIKASEEICVCVNADRSLLFRKGI